MQLQTASPALAAATLLAASGVLCSTRAQAQTLNWNNPAGGAASLSGNWSPTAVPGSANALVWNLNNTYVTTFNNLTFSSLSHTYKRGTVSLSMTSPHGTGNVVVADLAGDIATTRLINGSFNVSGLTVANAATSSGTLEINGGSSTLTIGGTADAIIGNNGNAALNILNGGQLTVPDQFLAGGNSTSTTTVLVSGEEAGVRASTLNVTGTTDSRIGAGGDVTMLVDAGATAAFSGNVIVANGSASTSSLRIRSASTASQVSVAGTLSLGRNISNGIAAGNGSLFVESGGRLTVTGVTNLGNDPDGGSGLFRMSGSSPVIQLGGLNIGAAGTLELFGGSLTIEGPITVPAGYQLQLPAPGAPASSSLVVLMRSGASYTSTGATSIGGVANAGGFFTIGNAATFQQSGSDFNMSPVVGGSSSVVVNSGGTLQSDAAIVVGGSGSAQLQVLGGGSLTCRDMDIARTSTANGSVSVSNSTLTVTEDLVVGGASNGSGGFGTGGSGTLTIASGGVVNTPINRGAYITGNGTLTINNGTMNIGGSLTCAGTYTQNSGTVNAQSMELYGTSSGRGTINARLLTGSTFTLTGALTLGLNASDAVDRVVMNVGPHTLTCVDSDVAILANTSINGGSINAANGLQQFAGTTLSGTGFINADFTNLGTVTATGTAGIRFTRSVTSTTGQLGGTLIHFTSTSSYTGRNTSGGAKWLADVGSTVTFTTSSSTIGDNSVDGVDIRGTLDVGVPVIFNDTGGLKLGTLTTLRNSTLSVLQSPVTIERTNTTRCILRGAGTLLATTSSSGTISPGFDEGDRTGTLTIGGFYSQSVTGDTGELIIDIDGLGASAHDTLALNGGGAVDGILRLRIGYSPANGNRIQIVTRGGTNTILTGTFDQLIAPVGWSLDYRTDSIDAVFCASDYNADGTADFFDYLDFVADFSSGDIRADFNFDGVIDFFDYLDFVAAFSSGC